MNQFLSIFDLKPNFHIGLDPLFSRHRCGSCVTTYSEEDRLLNKPYYDCRESSTDDRPESDELQTTLKFDRTVVMRWKHHEDHSHWFPGLSRECDRCESVESFFAGGVPFGNGQWLPVDYNQERNIYWWDFPWMSHVVPEAHKSYHSLNPFTIWKLVAGKTVTHLPHECIDYMAPFLSLHIRHHYHRYFPTIFYFGQKFESVLEVFTERMLGLVDEVPLQKHKLLRKIMKKTGFIGQI